MGRAALPSNITRVQNAEIAVRGAQCIVNTPFVMQLKSTYLDYSFDDALCLLFMYYTTINVYNFNQMFS